MLFLNFLNLTNSVNNEHLKGKTRVFGREMQNIFRTTVSRLQIENLFKPR